MAEESKKLRNVKAWVHGAVEELGGYFKMVEYGRYRAMQGSAEIFVEVEEDVDGEVLVRFHSPVAYQAELSERDLIFLLQANDNLPVATFSVSEEGTVRVGQCLIGEFCQTDEILRTVRAVALAADCLDDLIAERVGGKRSIDVKPWLKRR